ncbi:MAG: hypothetical protein KF723_08510 [Rhizobiaceae bacterium]|nr:hypothetical protein [Rhizobiaceae bacterium]
MAYLLEVGSAYHWLIATADKVNLPNLSVGITPDDCAEFRRIGKKWSTDPNCPPDVKKLWDKLLTFADEPVCNFDEYKRKGSPKPPKWLKVAFSLLAIADHAAEDVGYKEPPGEDWSDRWVVRLGNLLLDVLGKVPADRHLRLSDQAPSITSEIDWDVLCVQPKARTSGVGCSLRNLSHNLALMPPRGKIAGFWLTPQTPLEFEEKSTLNVLAIPFPYRLENRWLTSNTVFGSPSQSRWGWFDLAQGWLVSNERQMIEYVALLMDEAAKRDVVHAVVFPELALNYEIYLKIAEYIRDNYRGVQFLVSGSSSNCADEKGNFALATHFFDDFSDPKIPSSKRLRCMATSSRPKHHRWSLDKGQIDRYGLADRFPDPVLHTDLWWEKINVPPRQIHFHPMRSGSIFSVMICEDLARSDPAHDPLKSVGPNLVFVLLFDGPQMEWRWANRYSTGLAEDPGSSVMTLTSRALMERWITASGKRDEWAVGLWKDGTNRAKPLICPPGTDALLIKLQGTVATEYTLDGRESGQSFRWSMLDGVGKVALDRKRYGAILKRMGAAQR